jgi:hypothetical protein
MVRAVTHSINRRTASVDGSVEDLEAVRSTLHTLRSNIIGGATTGDYTLAMVYFSLVVVITKLVKYSPKTMETVVGDYEIMLATLPMSSIASPIDDKAKSLILRAVLSLHTDDPSSPLYIADPDIAEGLHEIHDSLYIGTAVQ